MYLTDRASMLRALFRLIDTDTGDGAVTEYDGPMHEGVLLLIQQGAEDAQSYMLGAGSTWWIETSAALAFTPEPDGRQYTELTDGLPPAIRPVQPIGRCMMDRAGGGASRSTRASSGTRRPAPTSFRATGCGSCATPRLPGGW